jgi:mono/diheme cytochrome c family protein
MNAALAIALTILVAQSGLPEGAGAAVLKVRCLMCHEADLITSQRLSRVGWTREIDKMVRWGAQVPDADREALVGYLSEHFGPSMPGRRSVDLTQPREGGPGERVFAVACVACHEGAPVPPADKDARVDYLTARTVPR